MKFNKIITKMPLFCLLLLSALISDAVYDGILPWPSPFRIEASCRENSFSVSFSLNDHASRQAHLPEADHYIPTDFDGEPEIGDPFAELAMQSAAGSSDASGDSSVPSVSTPDSAENTGTKDSSGPVRIIGEDGLPVIHYLTVEDDYFDDAVFIGDSRIRSLQLYAQMNNTTFLADTGLTVYTVLNRKLTPSGASSKTTVTDYLATHQFKKIYIMLGINELGIGNTDTFCQKYAEVLTVLRELQPDAIIYLQAILHISEKKQKEGTYINNQVIIARNEALMALADNVHIFWLDANPELCDEQNYLIGRYTFDGVHLQAKYVSLWTDFIRRHAIDEQDLLLELPKDYVQANPL